MSQTTETSEITSVRSVETNRESAGVAVAAVLAVLGRAAFGAARIGAKVAAGGAHLAWRGAAKAVASMSASDTGAQGLRPLPASLRAEVMGASSLSAALNALASAGTRLADTAAIEPLLEKANAAFRLGHEKESRQTLAALADEAAAQHQRLLADCVLTHAVTVVRERGFSVVRLVPERGYLLAERANGESLRVDVNRVSAGGVRYAVDADGFIDDRCIEEVSGFHSDMHRHGVDGEVVRSVRKPRIPLRHKVTAVAQSH